MSKKTNMDFLEAYIALETACNEKYQLRRGGVSEYVNRLIDARFAPDRDDILPKLIRYRSIRNKMAHEEKALASGADITRSDVRWVKNFAKRVERQKDPVSKYHKKERRYLRNRMIGRIAIIVGVVAVCAAAVAFLFKLGIF